MALDAARGVLYLHSFNPPILHRDLKSLNLLLDEAFRTKLADFGWTRTLANYMTSKIGTYQWMAPEVIAGQVYTEKADVFSFGIILWEIAAREPPYRSKTMHLFRHNWSVSIVGCPEQRFPSHNTEKDPRGFRKIGQEMLGS